MLKIRLQRIGRRNNPSYRIVVVDSRAAAKKGKPVEALGVHDTIRGVTSIDKNRVIHWISRGAQVSDTMHNILIVNGVIQGVKKNVLPKKHPIRKESDTKETAESAAVAGAGGDSPAAASATDGVSAPAPDTSADSSGDSVAQAQESSASPESDAAQPDTPQPAVADMNSQPDTSQSDTPQPEASVSDTETPASQDIHKNPSDEG